MVSRITAITMTTRPMWEVYPRVLNPTRSDNQQRRPSREPADGQLGLRQTPAASAYSCGVVAWADVRAALRGGPPVVPQGRVAVERLPAGLAAVVATSGTTGTSKLVALSRDALLSAAGATQARFGSLRWTCALPTNYIAGLMTLVRAHIADLPPRLAAPDLSDLSAVDEPSGISLVATQLYRAIANPATRRLLRGYELIMVGGSSVSAGLLERARDAGLAVTLSYGMTETCGGCVYDGVPLAGVDVTLSGEPGLPTGEGRILVGGPTLFDGYLDAKGKLLPRNPSEPFRTSDRGRWEGGLLVVSGRTDAVVITGGVNVDLASIQRRLDDEPVRAVVCAVPDAEWGQRIMLVAEPGRSLAQWRDRLAPSVNAPGMPKGLVVVDTLPATDRGKFDMLAIQRLAEGGSDGDGSAMG